MKLKKLASLVLALVMALALAAPAFAADPEPATPTNTDPIYIPSGNTTNDPANGDGKIVIEHAIPTATYDVYRIFELTLGGELTEGESNPNVPHNYVVTDAWKGFFQGTEAGLTYFDVVTDKDGKMNAVLKEEYAEVPDFKDFADAAIKYAKDNKINPYLSGQARDLDATEKEAQKADKRPRTVMHTFDKLALGYYLVSSTGGALCELTTTNKVQTIQEKNEPPKIEKTVEASDQKYVDETGKETSVRVGDYVTYTVTIEVEKGAQGYRVIDTMNPALRLAKEKGFTVKMNGTDVEAAKYTVYTELDPIPEALKDVDGITTDTTFVLDFDADYIKELGEQVRNGTEITLVITYQAQLTEAAATVEGPLKNTVQLKYGNNSTVDGGDDVAEVKPVSFELVKTDDANKLLDGAIFKLYETDSITADRVALKFNKGTDGKYTVLTDQSVATGEQEDGSTITDEIEVKDGRVTIVGLAEDYIYYLNEIKAPEQYNILTEDVKFVLNPKTDEANPDKYKDIQQINTETAVKVENETFDTTGGGLAVVNKTGAQLPSTGGIGTTIFYIVGGVLAAGAVILLITKRRMNMDK